MDQCKPIAFCRARSLLKIGPTPGGSALPPGVGPIFRRLAHLPPLLTLLSSLHAYELRHVPAHAYLYPRRNTRRLVTTPRGPLRPFCLEQIRTLDAIDGRYNSSRTPQAIWPRAENCGNASHYPGYNSSRTPQAI